MSVFYYILVDPDKPTKTKIGITSDHNRRIKAYKTAAPSCYFLQVYAVDSKIHEKKLLDLLRDRFVVQSEYIHCHPTIVKNIVEGYFTDN